MAVDSEAKRWSMLAFASGPVRSHVFNPETSGVVSIERITVLQYYGGVAWTASTYFAGAVASDGGHIWPARGWDPRWVQILIDSGISQSGNFIDDMFLALETATGVANYSVDDLWDLFKAQNSITDTSEPFTY